MKEQHKTCPEFKYYYMGTSTTIINMTMTMTINFYLI